MALFVAGLPFFLPCRRQINDIARLPDIMCLVIHEQRKYICRSISVSLPPQHQKPALIRC